MSFSFPHKTEAQAAEIYNSKGWIWGILPIYFQMTQNQHGQWALDYNPSRTQPYIEERAWVPRPLAWVFITLWAGIGMARVLLTGGEGMLNGRGLMWTGWLGSDDPPPGENG